MTHLTALSGSNCALVMALAAQTRGPDAAGLLPGMTYGDRSGLDTGLEEAMKVTGLTHLTAVSGDRGGLQGA